MLAVLLFEDERDESGRGSGDLLDIRSYFDCLKLLIWNLLRVCLVGVRLMHLSGSRRLIRGFGI